MGNVGVPAGIVIEGWGENIQHDLLTLSATPTKLDPQGAQTLYIFLHSDALLVHISPVDTVATGMVLIRDTTSNSRPEPYWAKIGIKGNPPVFLSAPSGSPSVSIIRIYDED